jgi:hypothetical protein
MVETMETESPLSLGLNCITWPTHLEAMERMFNEHLPTTGGRRLHHRDLEEFNREESKMRILVLSMNSIPSTMVIEVMVMVAALISIICMEGVMHTDVE